MVNYELIKRRANDLLFPNANSKLLAYKEAYAWYRNDKEEIKKQIQKSLHKSIVKNYSKIQNKIKRYPYVNKIPKAVSRLCNLYKDSPEREIRIDGEIDEELTELYNDLAMECNLDVLMNDNHKLAMFFNTIIVGPYFEDGELFLRTYLPFEYIVIPNNNDKSRIDALLLLNRTETEPDKFEDSVVVWTKEKHYIITSDLNSKVVNTNTEKKNPHGIIPFAVLKMNRDNYDFQGCGMEWLTEIFLSMSVNLTYQNFQIPYGVGGILVAKNVDFTKAKKDEPLQEIQINNQTVDLSEQKDASIEVALDSVLSLKDSYTGNDADLKFLSLQTDLSIVRNEVDWLAKNCLSDLGIDLNSIVLERGYTSGFGIVAESTGLMEIRKGHIPILMRFERDLFKIIKKLLQNEPDMEDYFDEEAELYIDYQEPTFPRTIEEMDKEREMKLKYNTINIFDIAKEDNLDITSNEEARQLLEENRKINEKYKPSAFGFGGINSLDESVEEETESEETEKYEPTEKELEQGYYVADLGDGATYTAEILEKPFEVTGSKELGSKELDMPNDRQFSYYDCGDAVVITALARFGIEPNPENLIDDLGTTQDWGTEPKNIKSVLESYGLTVEMKPMTFQDIKNYIDNDIAVILDIQAWHDEDITYYDYTDEWEDGHYVNVYGYTETTVKLKDPSSMMNRELTWVELQRRWHDVDREGNKFYNMGIAYWGLPIKWGSDKTEAIG